MLYIEDGLEEAFVGASLSMRSLDDGDYRALIKSVSVDNISRDLGEVVSIGIRFKFEYSIDGAIYVDEKRFISAKSMTVLRWMLSSIDINLRSLAGLENKVQKCVGKHVIVRKETNGAYYNTSFIRIGSSEDNSDRDPF